MAWGDGDDLSKYVGRNMRKDDGEAFIYTLKPRRRIRTSDGLPTLEFPRERVWCRDCRKFIRFKDLFTDWEFERGKAFRLRFHKTCGSMVQEKEFDLTK